jgi:O-methyltransferase
MSIKAFARAAMPAAYDAASKVKAAIARATETRPDFAHDGMKLYGKSMDWLHDEAFVTAYAAGMNTGHHVCRPKGSTEDIRIEYRVYLCCWAARHAAKLPGDFVECGVNTGITSVAICTLLDFGRVPKRFFLFDTYRGLPMEQAIESERAARAIENDRYYEECFALATRNFAKWPNCILVRGRIPETLGVHEIERVAYLHLDMNLAAPEVAAIGHFWPRMTTGGVVMLDDYGFEQYRPQKVALDAWARSVGVEIATLPTGQGLILKA